MKKVSEQELKRLKKKGGVKVKRKLGTGKKKSEPEVPVEAALSGASDTEPPAPQPTVIPVSVPAPAVDMKPYAAMSASIATSNANIANLIKNNTRMIQDFNKKLTNMEPAELTKWQAADFIRHKVKRDGFKLIEYIDSVPMRNRG